MSAMSEMYKRQTLTAISRFPGPNPPQACVAVRHVGSVRPRILGRPGGGGQLRRDEPADGAGAAVCRAEQGGGEATCAVGKVAGCGRKPFTVSIICFT